MSDHISTLAQKLRPYWLRDQTNGSGGVAASGGGGGGMAAHALFGVYHTGELDPSQAPWAVTQEDLDAIDTHARQHDVFDPADHIANGAAGQIAGFTALNTWGKLTPTDGIAASGSNLILASGVAGLGLTYTSGVLDVGVANTGATGLTVETNAVRLTSSSNVASIPAAAILASDSNGMLAVKALTVGTTDETTGTGNLDFLGHAVISAARSAWLFIDSDNNSTAASFTIGKDSGNTTSASTLFEFTEAGRLNVGVASVISGVNDVNAEPDIKFFSNGLISAEGSIYFNIDSNNDSTGAGVFWLKDATTTAGTQIMVLNETGVLTVLDRVRVPIVDTAGGEHLLLQPAGDLLLDPDSNLIKLQPNTFIQSSNYASQLTGVRVSWLGEGDFRYLYADELHAKAFIADLEQALAGGQIITKSVTILASNFTAPAAGGSTTLHVKDLPSATGMQVFQSGDIIRLREFSRAGGSLSITNCWGVVTSPSDNADGTQNWTFTRSTGGNAGAMTASTVVEKDAIVLDYGTSGNGYYEVNAIDGMYALNSPYAQIVSWTTHPATGQTVRSRLGNLRGIFGVTDEYGLYAGDGTANTNQYLRISSDNVRINNIPLQMYSGGVQTFNLSSDGTNMWIGPNSSNKQLSYSSGNLTITGQINATTGEIANWDIGVIDANTISSNNIKLTAGATGTARIEVGSIGDDIAGMVSRTTAAAAVFWAGKSYANLISSPTTVPFRVNLNGDLFASNADITGKVTATSGAIGGWTIDADELASGSDTVRLLSGANGTAGVYVGGGAVGSAGFISRSAASTTLITLWAGMPFDTSVNLRDNAPFSVTMGGILRATGAIISGTVTVTDGSVGGWTIATGLISSSNIRLYSGTTGVARIELGTGTDANTAGIFAGTAVAGSIAFWAGGTFANRNLSTTPFRVYMNGDLYASSATITGAITANSGAIGGASGWTITTGQISSGNISLVSGVSGAARLDVGTAGVVGVAAVGETQIWAGQNYNNKEAAPFRVYDNGQVTVNTLTVAGASLLTGSLTIGYPTATIRLGTDGQRMLLPSITSGVDVPTSSSAIRWFPSLSATYATTANYTGMVGYRYTVGATKVVDMLLTSVVGSTDEAAGYSSRTILQAGHYTGGVYSDALLVVTKEPDDDGFVDITAKQLTLSENLYVTNICSALSYTDRTPAYDGDGLADLRKIKGKGGDIDHSTLPEFARRQVVKRDKTIEEGRDLGAMISILVAAVAQLDNRLDKLEGK